MTVKEAAAAKRLGKLPEHMAGIHGLSTEFPVVTGLTSIEDGRSMSLGEDEAVGAGVAWLAHLVPHGMEEQHGHDLRHGRT